MMKDQRRLSRWASLMAVVCMSTSVVFVRKATAPSMVLALYRMVISALLMLPAVLLHHREELKAHFRLKEMLPWALSGVCFGLHFLAYFESLSYTAITTAVMLSSTEVFYVAVCAFLFLHETISRKGWVGIGVTFAGSVMLALAQGMQGGGNIKGVVIGVLAAVFAAAFTLLGRRCRAKVSNTLYTFVVFVFGSLTLLAGCLLSGLRLTGYGTNNLLAALGMAVACTLLGHSLLMWALRYQTAAYVSSVKMLIPVFSTLFGWIFVGEAPQLTVLLCCGVIIAGILYYFKHE